MRFLTIVERLASLWNRVRSIRKRDEQRADLAEEMAFHRAQLAGEFEKRGTPARQAQRQASIRFGHTAHLIEESSDAWQIGLVDALTRDVRYALRQMRRHAVITTVAVVSIALGVGLNAGMFAILNAVMLRPLPVSQPEDLRIISMSESGAFTSSHFPLPSVQLLQRDARSLTGIAASSRVSYVSVERNGTRSHTPNGAELISGNYFDVLRVRPWLGRLIRAEDADSLAPQLVAVLSYQFWNREYGADSSLIGRSARFNGVEYRVIGVTPPEFFGDQVGRAPDLYVPITTDDVFLRRPAQFRKDAGNWWVQMLGRARPGTSDAAISAELTQLMQRFLLESEGPTPDPEEEKKIRSVSLDLADGSGGHGQLRGAYAQPLQLLWALSLVVLLIACTNVVGLLFGRMDGRRQEFVIRTAIGATQRHIARQLLVEGTATAIVGAVAGLALARAFASVIQSIVFTSASSFQLAIASDARVWAIGLGATALVVAGLALGPALLVVRHRLADGLRGRTDSSGGTGLRRSGRALNIVQLALAMPLVVTSILFARTIANLQQVSLGYDPERVAVIWLDGVRNGYSGERVVATYRNVVAALEQVRGVSSVSAASYAPLSGSRSSNSFRYPGFTSAEHEGHNVQIVYVDPAYFRTMGTPILSGREFLPGDSPRGRNVAVVSTKVAQQYLGGLTAAVAKHMAVADDSSGAYPIEVVGVAREAVLWNVREEGEGAVYLPFLADTTNVRFASILVRLSTGASPDLSMFRRAIASVDPALEVLDIKLLKRQFEAATATERVVTNLSTAFGVLALLLAALGIYGVVAHDVMRRSHEIGVRLAVGATPRSIHRLVLHSVLVVLAGGFVVGAPLAVVGARASRALLFGISATDPWTVPSVLAVFTLTVLVAAWIPARRGARLDPLTTLRSD